MQIRIIEYRALHARVARQRHALGHRAPQAAQHLDAPFAAITAAGLVAFAGLLLAVLAPGSEVRSGALLSAGAVSALLLGLLDCARPRMTALALRAAADLAMLTPLVLLLR